MKPVISGLIVLLFTMRLYAQNVGIGTTSPQQKLHVQGNTFISDSLGIGAVNPLQKLHVQGNTYVRDSLGIGAASPAFPLSFGPLPGSKISLLNGLTNSGIYGLGVQPGLLQVFADSSTADIAFGYGSSTAFTENVRMTGSGRTGIGTASPLQKLHVQGSTYISGRLGIGNATPQQQLHVQGNAYIADSVGIGAVAPAFPLGFAPVFGDKISLMNTASFGGIFGLGTQQNLLQIYADTAASDIAFGYGSSALFTENMRIKGNGNVGISTQVPTYKLDIMHEGGTGIRSRSSASFSVIDIDAFTGDAALRFINNGINQWNIRNRPADNYLEIFEMGGGGSRVVIQDSTGNVGIGPVGAPAYKLDVAHFGADGARIRSSNGFSVLDIDAFDGDAGLRLARNTVYKWNIRNRPGDNGFEIFAMGINSGSRLVVQDSTGNVGIGGVVAPAYKLDVQHTGGLAGRFRSTAGFSALDVDAFDGDAAVRFVRNGVNQWNIRNRPLDNFFEIFEMGGGGSRFIIQDGTGNVGIGPVTTPAYRLDVQHSGGTGGRIRSSASFSVLDIDAANGEASLRFAAAGVNQWNIRNRPGDNYLEFFEMGGGGSRVVIQDATGNMGINFNLPTAKLHIGGSMTATGAKAFTIDHPLDPENKMLRHFAIESNEVLNSYSGNIITGADGKAVVQLPDYFDAINTDFRYQLTVIGSFTQAIISKKITGNRFEIATAQPGVEVSWEVKARRNDGYMKYVNTMQAEEIKPAAMRGKYIEPAAFNLPENRGVNYDANTREANGGQPSSITHSAPAPAANRQMPATGSVEDLARPANANKVPANGGSILHAAIRQPTPPPAPKPAGKTSTDN